MSGRSNDLNAEPFAMMLKTLKSEIYVIKSNQNRYELDDNRYSNNNKTIKKDSVLWNTLRNTLKNNDDTNIVLDIHSFPNNSFNNCFRLNNPCEIVLLDYSPYQELTKKIYNHLINNNVNSKITEAKIGSNSIIDILTLNPFYTPAVLIEVNENLTKERMMEIAKIISSII